MINKDNSLKSLVNISCSLEEGVTKLQDSYADMPYMVRHYGNRLHIPYLELLIMSSSPGLLAGDSLDLRVGCPAGTQMKLHTQSFNKVHPMPNGEVKLNSFQVQLEERALFHYLPFPTIPYAEAVYHAQNDIYLKGSSSFIWSDIISGGRIHSGEAFAFTEVHSRTQVFRDGKLVLLDNLYMNPATQPIQQLLFFEGFTHQGTWLMVSPYANDFKKELDEVLLAQPGDMKYGFTQAADNVLLIRCLGDSGEGIHDWMANLGAMAWSFCQHRLRQDTPTEEATEKPAEAEKQAEENELAL